MLFVLPENSGKIYTPGMTGNKFIKVLRIAGRILAWSILSIFFLFFLIVIIIRTPYAQQKIVSFATSWFSEKTGSHLSIDKLFVTFSGNALVEGLYLEDQEGDTLIYSSSLEAGIALRPLISGNINITGITWNGLIADVKRPKNGDFNFQFIIDAFASPDKEEPGETPEIKIGPVRFSDFRLSFNDEQNEISSSLILGTLALKLKSMDLETNSFHVRNLDFENSEIQLIMRGEPTEKLDTASTDTTSFNLTVDNLLFENIKFLYDSRYDSLVAEGSLGELQLQLEKFDLLDQHLAVKNFSLDNTSINLKLPPVDTTQQPAASTSHFEWPDWEITINQLDLTNNSAGIAMGNDPPTIISDVNIALKDIRYQPEDIYLQLVNASASGLQGFQLDQLQFTASLTDKSFDIRDLRIKTPYSRLHSNLEIRYSDAKRWIENPIGGQAILKVEDLYIGENDMRRISEYTTDSIAWWASQPVRLKTSLEFSEQFARIHFLNASRGNHTHLELNGDVSHPVDPERLTTRDISFSLVTKTEDWKDFLPDTEDLHLPDSLHLTGNANGSLSDLTAHLELTSLDGNLTLKGIYSGNKEEKNFSGELIAVGVDPGKILKQPDIGLLEGQFEFDGTYSGEKGIHAEVIGEFSQLELYGYDYNALKTNITMADKFIYAAIQHHNSDLQLNLHASAVLDSINPSYGLELDLRGADLQALQLTPQAMRLRLKTSASFKGNAEIFDASILLTDGLIVKNETSYLTEEIELTANATPEATGLNLQSDFLVAEFEANAPPLDIVSAFKEYLRYYFDKSEPDESNIKGVTLSGKMELRQTRLLSEVLVPGISQMNPVMVEINFDQDARLLNSEFSVPRIQYEEANLSGLYFISESNPKSMDFSLGFERLSTGPVNIHKTLVTGNWANNELNIEVSVNDEEENKIYQIESLIVGRNDSIQVHIIPDNLLLKGESWKIPTDNELVFFTPSIQVKNFNLQSAGQSLILNTRLPDQTTNHLGIQFEQFELSTLTTLLNPKEAPVEGKIQGQIILEDPLEKLMFTAGLSITQLKALGQLLGTLNIEAVSTSPGNYQADVNLQGDETDIDLKGSYHAKEEGMSSQLDLTISKLGLAVIEGLSNGEIKDATGDLIGNFNLETNGDTMIYNGVLRFENASLLITKLNAPFSFSNDKIEVNNTGLFLDRFEITDAGGNKFSVRGKVTTESFEDPGFDLQLNAQNFLLLNSSREDNDLFYGKALIDADIKVTGNLSLPFLEVRGKLNEGTDLTVIIPEPELDIIEREGVVMMVNMEDPDDIMTRTDEKQPTRGMTGLEVRALVKVGPDVTLRILIDESTGDNLEITGEADFSFDHNRNGEMSLSGTYELSSGSYEMSLYNIVSRRLELVPGSSITWSGDPLNASLDLTALYRTRASAGDLMADQLTGADATVRTRYRQELPFEVLLQIKGSLLRPDISFALDMPENQRGALDGTVYGRLQQLNNTESELNKQVFGLLVFGKFFPEGSSLPQERASTESMARSSVSQVLSGQLNSLSERHIKGVEIDFNLDSFTDYQSGTAEDRTQLNVNLRKNLFSDRVVLQVGSQVDLEGRPEGQPQGVADILGDVSLEYLLTEDGRFRLRGFRKNQFEGLVEGQIITTGLSFIFNKEFNLWKDALKRQEEKKRNNATDAEAAEYMNQDSRKEEDQQ